MLHSALRHTCPIVSVSAALLTSVYTCMYRSQTNRVLFLPGRVGGGAKPGREGKRAAERPAVRLKAGGSDGGRKRREKNAGSGRRRSMTTTRRGSQTNVTRERRNNNRVFFVVFMCSKKVVKIHIHSFYGFRKRHMTFARRRLCS